MTAAAVAVIQVVGGKNAGKTTVARALVAEFVRRGYVVGAVKHSHHPVPPDDAGTDSELLARAGAAITAFCGGDGTVVRTPAARSLAEALEPLRGRVDIAVVESFSSERAGAVLRVAREPAQCGGASARLTGPDGLPWLACGPIDVPGIVTAFQHRTGLAPAPR